MKFGTISALARWRLRSRGRSWRLAMRWFELAGKVADLGRGASAATVGEAASLDYVLLAVPWPNVEDA